MLFWKAALLAPAGFIEKNTFGQLLGICVMQFISKRRITRFLASVGVQYSASTRMYIVPSNEPLYLESKDVSAGPTVAASVAPESAESAAETCLEELHPMTELAECKWYVLRGSHFSRCVCVAWPCYHRDVHNWISLIAIRRAGPPTGSPRRRQAHGAARIIRDAAPNRHAKDGRHRRGGGAVTPAGTGKTTIPAITILHQIRFGVAAGPGIQALVMLPTHARARQAFNIIHGLAQCMLTRKQSFSAGHRMSRWQSFSAAGAEG